MCETLNIDEYYQTIHNARLAAEEILKKYLHLDVQKAYDLKTPAGFDRAVIDLSQQLRKTVSSVEDDAVRAALKVLDVDWYETTAEQRRALIERSMTAAGLKNANIPVLTEVVFGVSGVELVKATRESVRINQSLKIGVKFNALDKRITRYLKTSNSTFIRDEYGRRNAAFGKQAAYIVSEGLRNGLGRDDIARNLEMSAFRTIAGRGANYWDVVAGAFMGRGRSFAQLSAYREADIAQYVIEAVLDEVTTETCRFLHGKVFSVDRGIKLFEAVEQNPDALKELNPWVRMQTNKNGEQVLFVNKGDRKVPIATVSNSGFGAKDDIGSFRNTLSEKEMMDLGLGFPPYHGSCRTSCLAVT